MLIRLYKLINDELHYWETWDTEEKLTIIHWGKVGETGQHIELNPKLHTDYKKIIQNEMNQKISEGYCAIEEEKFAVLEIEYTIDDFGSEADLDLRHRLEEQIDEVLGCTGLGFCDGGSIGSGSMEVCCVVVDFEIAKKVIEESLLNTEFSNYSSIINISED